MNAPDPFAPPQAKRELSEDEALQKRFMYEKMSPRRRKFVDRLGYEQWDPFATPKEPLDIRQEGTGRTAHELVRDFMKWRARQDGALHRVEHESDAQTNQVNLDGQGNQRSQENKMNQGNQGSRGNQENQRPGGDTSDSAYARGVLECAVSIINRDDKYRGIYDFCVWYSEQLHDD